MGLSFSVPPGKAVPSSLQNIYKELRDDCKCTIPKHGDLEKVSALLTRWLAHGSAVIAMQSTIQLCRFRMQDTVYVLCRSAIGKEGLLAAAQA